MARRSIPGSNKRKQPATKARSRKPSSRQTVHKQDSNKHHQLADRPQTSPDLFLNATSTSMASALPIWEASSILTQRKDLPWSADPNGKLCYTKEVENGKGAALFWVTEDLEHDYPATLAGAAALAVIDAFDIRAACMHLIYAAHATQLDQPWEQEFVIDDRQIEDYLGLKKRTDKNRQQKLALIKEIAQQPCQITTFISWPAQGRARGFTISETRLWNMLEIQHHYDSDLFSNQELVGLTFRVKAGYWAKYFLNEEGRAELSTYCQTSILSKVLLADVMRVWQQREGAARLMIWLLFKTKIDMKHSLSVQTLMEIAYGPQKIEAARLDNRLRSKLANTWDEDLLVLHDRGWHLHFHSETYYPEIQPFAFGRSNHSRPRSFFEQLLSAQIWISPPDSLTQKFITPEIISRPQVQQTVLPVEAQCSLTGTEVRTLRNKKGWTQRQLASLTGLSQSLIQLIEKNQRTITRENQEILERTLKGEPGDSTTS
ncbi:helix-turn-helix transcriptional regulator [Chroococcidiopsis sp. CCMEE 29]|uniref:helix-turn-helix domain-containing protein n=1 Tax=Chroococcidiopsis sp. CCMEE 29 TaxID=155894 RepID=UPI002021C088|nr:helix-turn-helix transcriptional regulator [Chroococcidiopsis sp. CCMEE 29]